MADDESRAGARLEAIEARLEAIERRLAAVEAGAGRGGAAVAPRSAAPASPPASPPVAAPGAGLALIGRTLVVLGGAFFLRAVTEAGVVPQFAGTAAGLGYAYLWIQRADAAARRERRASAAFHGLAGAGIAFPLLGEATLKFHFLSPALGAAAIAVTAALGLGVAWKRALAGLAWVVAGGACIAALALAFATRAFFPFTVCLLLLGLSTLWLGYARGWRVLAWLVAGLCDAMLLVLDTSLVAGARPEGIPGLGHAGLLTLQLGTIGVYFGSIAARTLQRGRDVAAMEVAQSVAVFALGLGGAVMLLRASPGLAVLVGVVTLVLAAGCYGAAFTFIDRRLGRRRNFLFYSTLALVLALVGWNALLDGAVLAGTYAAIAAFTAWLGSRKQRATLSGHGAFFVTAAAIQVGLLRATLAAFFAREFHPVAWATAPVLLVLGVSALCCWLDVATHGRTWGRLSLVPKLVALSIFVSGAGAILVTLAGELLGAGREGPGAAATLAAVRTGILAVAALVLAWASRWRRLAAATWLVYPVLILGGAKLVLEDLRHGRAVTLFASLVLYGSALILAPRLRRRSR